jgi:NADH-quinone oxidoreductase subunit J
MDAVLFYFFGAVALVAALVVVGQRNPIYSAFALILTLCSLSAIYGLLGSPFIAVLQIVVYAGAIMVLFLFVLMLLSVKPEEEATRSSRALRATALGLVVLLVGQGTVAFFRGEIASAVPTYDASTARMAQELFSERFLYVFEATSILILASLVGAVALGRKEGPK